MALGYAVACPFLCIEVTNALRLDGSVVAEDKRMLEVPNL
jgi:hypothetical protein